MQGMRYGGTALVGHGFYGSTNQVGRGVLKRLNKSKQARLFSGVSISLGLSSKGGLKVPSTKQIIWDGR